MSLSLVAPICSHQNLLIYVDIYFRFFFFLLPCVKHVHILRISVIEYRPLRVSLAVVIEANNLLL